MHTNGPRVAVVQFCLSEGTIALSLEIENLLGLVGNSKIFSSEITVQNPRYFTSSGTTGSTGTILAELIVQTFLKLKIRPFQYLSPKTTLQSS